MKRNSPAKTDDRWIVRSQNQIATFFGIHPRTVPLWIASGMPTRKIGKGNTGSEYDLSAIAVWVRERSEEELAEDGGTVSPELEKWRKVRRIDAEFDLAVKRKTVVPRAAADAAVDTLGHCYERWLREAMELVGRLVPDSCHEVERLVETALARVNSAMDGWREVFLDAQSRAIASVAEDSAEPYPPEVLLAALKSAADDYHAKLAQARREKAEQLTQREREEDERRLRARAEWDSIGSPFARARHRATEALRDFARHRREFMRLLPDFVRTVPDGYAVPPPKWIELEVPTGADN